jgi:riboflavin kinase/FMN adenylyltransferase
VKILHKLEELKGLKNPILTIGTFDGVHIGHQKIIQQINQLAEKEGGTSTLFTFHPHPRMVLNPSNHGIKLIQSQTEKQEKLNRLGLDTLIVYPFTKDFSQLTATEFVENILVKQIGVKTIVIGYDHQFGKNREGTLDLLLKFAPKHKFNVLEISAEDINNVNVSSTKIRTALTEGDIETANAYLGEAFTLTGTVVKGQQIGRSINFPTANLALDEIHKIIPKNGAYAVTVKVENEIFKGMLNIGTKPTVNFEKEDLFIEVHLFDFTKDIYHKSIQLNLFYYIREEMHFKSLELLKSQLKNDETQIRNLLN